MRTVLAGLAMCAACLAEPAPDVEIVVPPSAAHPQSWLPPRIPNHPDPDDHAKPANSLAEFVAPEVISRIVVDQYAGRPDDVRRYLTALPTAEAKYFGPSLVVCPARSSNMATDGISLVWTSTSAVTFESGKTGKLAVATVNPSSLVAGTLATRPPGCLGPDQIPFDSLYVSYIDPEGHSWYFAVPLRRKK